MITRRPRRFNFVRSDWSEKAAVMMIIIIITLTIIQVIIVLIMRLVLIIMITVIIFLVVGGGSRVRGEGDGGLFLGGKGGTLGERGVRNCSGQPIGAARRPTIRCTPEINPP